MCALPDSGAISKKEPSSSTASQDPVRIVDPTFDAGDGSQQRLVAPVGGVGRFGPWRQLPHVGRQIGEEPADLAERIFFVLRQVVDDAVGDLHPFVAQVLLGDVDADTFLDDGGSGHEDLAGSPHHHAEMAQARLDRRQAGHGAEHRRDHRHLAEQLGGEVGRLVVGQVRVAQLLEGLDAASGRVEQAHQGAHDGRGRTLRHDVLVSDATVGGPATDGEVTAAQHRPAAVQFGGADHVVGRCERGQRAVGVPRRGAGQRPDLPEGARVLQGADPFPHRQLPPTPVEGDAVGTAHLMDHPEPTLELCDLILPTHRDAPFSAPLTLERATTPHAGRRAA